MQEVVGSIPIGSTIKSFESGLIRGTAAHSIAVCW
jgi:hypothetical protein